MFLWHSRDRTDVLLIDILDPYHKVVIFNRPNSDMYIPSWHAGKYYVTCYYHCNLHTTRAGYFCLMTRVWCSLRCIFHVFISSELRVQRSSIKVVKIWRTKPKGAVKFSLQWVIFSFSYIVKPFTQYAAIIWSELEWMMSERV